MAISLYSAHVERWKSCQRCALGRTRDKIVLAKGRLPCDVLFVGEAPGESEDVIGLPFVGPAGRLLDEMIRDAGYLGVHAHRLLTRSSCNCKRENENCPVCDWGLAVCGICRGGESDLDAPCREFRLAFTNVISCIPLGEDGNKVREPPEESVEACSERLLEFIKIVSPRLIVMVGKTAENYLSPGYKQSIPLHAEIPSVAITHPAAILRAREDQKDYAKQRVKIALRDALELLN